MTATRYRALNMADAEVKAILAGRKTQFHRVLTADQEDRLVPIADDTGEVDVKNPFGSPGDYLWVRESVAIRSDVNPSKDVEKALQYLFYRASYTGSLHDEWHNYGAGWRPASTMPRWASRLALQVESVGVQRLQAITEEDAVAEGAGFVINLRDGRANDNDMKQWCERTKALDPWASVVSWRGAFTVLWDRRNKAHPWVENPWVWVVRFSRAFQKNGVLSTAAGLIKRIRKGTFDRSDIDWLERTPAREVVDELRSSRFRETFQERCLGRKWEVSLARNANPGACYVGCVMLSVEGDRITGVSTLSRLGIQGVSGSPQDLDLTTGRGHKLDKLPDGWAMKPLRQHTARFSRAFLKNRGVLFA